MGDWRFAGEARVTEQGKINLPERLFNEGVLDSDGVAYWSYEKVQGFVVVSNAPLKKDIYKRQGSAPIGDPDQYRTNIPKLFFEDYVGSGRGDSKPGVPEKARVEYKQKRFFAFRDAMTKGRKRSCYMFTWDEFDKTIGDDDWADPLNEIPRFSP